LGTWGVGDVVSYRNTNGAIKIRTTTPVIMYKKKKIVLNINPPLDLINYTGLGVCCQGFLNHHTIFSNLGKLIHITPSFPISTK
jgi:hypothetical protein